MDLLQQAGLTDGCSQGHCEGYCHYQEHMQDHGGASEELIVQEFQDGSIYLSFFSIVPLVVYMSHELSVPTCANLAMERSETWLCKVA